MKTFFIALFASILLIGCSTKMDVASINQEIIPKESGNTTEFLKSKTYNTYDEKKGKITSYFFKEKDGKLLASSTITFIPMDYTGQLYSPISRMTFALKRLTQGKAKTIEEALAMEIENNNFKKLFNNKDEYIIGNEFARDLKIAISEFEDMIMRQEDREEKEDRGESVIIIPVI